MNGLLPAAVATGLVWASAAGAAVESRIHSVTVYPGQLARVERVAQVSADVGAGTLAFEGLPAAIEADSVRVAVEAGAATIGAVEVARQPVGTPPRERERELRQRIEALEAERRAALDRVAAARTQITFIEGLAKLPEGEGAAEALTAGDGAQRWTQLWERIGAGAHQARQRVRAGEREAARIKAEIDTLERRLERLGGSRPEAVRVAVPYRADAPGAVRLRLAYRVRGPTWEPLYETHLDTSAGRLRLIRRARVRQATGEDWDGVRLALATARPVRGDRPRPATWWVDLAPEAERAEQAAARDRALARGEGKVAEAPARTVSAEFAATYEIPGQVSVPAGNQARELRLATSELDARIGAHAFPQRDRRVWLTADATWSGDGPLPPGRVARFRDGAYVGSARLAGWSPGEARTLSFGVDPRIEVRFEPIRDEAGASGWITTKSTLARRYRLEVVNRHGRALPVHALFRVPVARAKSITVEADFSRPPSRRDVDDRQGVHAWDVELAPGGSTALELGYEVAYPEGRELRGM